jgi:hypothetical protein
LIGLFFEPTVCLFKEVESVSDEELEKTIEAMRKLREEHSGSPEKAHAFLVEAGFVNPDGTLHENYRQNA